MVRKFNLDRHARSRKHCKRAGVQDSDPATTTDENPRAPDAAKFHAVWKACCSGHGDSTMSHTVAAKIRFALREAVKQKQKRGLQSVKSLSVIQDAASNRLLVRYVGVTSSLEKVAGMVGCIQFNADDGCGAEATKSGTRRCVDSFCTEYYGMPPRGSWELDAKVQPVIDLQFKAKLCDSVACWCTDAEQRELIAGHELRLEPGEIKDPTGKTAAALFKNLSLVVRDRAHASRRIVRRPWVANSTLEDVFQKLVWKNQCPVTCTEFTHFESLVPITSTEMQSLWFTKNRCTCRCQIAQNPI